MSERKSYDPKMHTAEHLLNGTMNKIFNCGRSFSAHIEKKKSKCDYHFERDLTSEEVELIEDTINNVIKENHSVTEKFVTRDEAIDNFNLNKLPDDAGNSIRIINIGNYDACPCIGEHVKYTGDIGKFKIISTDYKNNILRIRFKLLNN